MIQVNILAHDSNRFDYTSKSLNFITKIKDENKSKIKIHISYTNPNDLNRWLDIKSFLIENGIETTINNDNSPYMSKIESFLQTDCDYSCSMDEDIMLNQYLWDYLIENISILDDDNNLFLSPLISNGIPAVEMFLEDFCTESDRIKMEKIFLNTKIPNLWGANYQLLNKNRDHWSVDYYTDVYKINHFYKGIHPVRVSYDAHIELLRIIKDNINKFLIKGDYKLEVLERPYFCNSFFFIKTKTWKNIIRNKSLFKDDYDEVPLNLYKDINNLKMVFVRQGFCLHMAYNTIGWQIQKQIENKYYQEFLTKI